MDELREQKKALRRKLRERAGTLDPAERLRADEAIRDAIQGSEAWQSAGAVFAYVSMWAEPDTRMLIEAALREGKTVFVPRCYPGRVMKAVRIDSLDALRPGTLGIPEPVDDSVCAAPGELALALVPCVSASRDGRRLEIVIQAAALVRKIPLQIGHKAGMMDGGGAVHHRVVMVKDQAFVSHKSFEL